MALFAFLYSAAPPSCKGQVIKAFLRGSALVAHALAPGVGKTMIMVTKHA